MGKGDEDPAAPVTPAYPRGPRLFVRGWVVVWTRYWAVWFFATVSTFLGPELWALGSGHPERTLSAQIWRLERFVPGESVAAWNYFHLLFAGVLLLLDVWLFGHFVLGWWRG